MKRAWPAARFDKILRRVERKFLLDDSTTYKCVGVRWYGNGAFVRESLLGMDIARKQQWTIRKGDVVYNKLFAWKGAFAVADDAVDGCIVSDKFPTYQHNETLVDLRFLSWFFRIPGLAQQAQDLSKGAAAISKLTLNPPQFWDMEIPLPPLSEQHRIMACIEELSAKVEEARALRRQAAKEATALTAATLYAATGRATAGGCLADVLAGKPHNGWSARCDNLESGTPVLSLAAVTGFHYRAAAFKRTSLLPTGREDSFLHTGDLLITRSNTPELVGHAAIYDGHPSPCLYPDLMMRLDVVDAKAEKRFVWYWLQTRTVRAFIAKNAKGTSPTMKKIAQGTVMAIPFPSHLGMPEQRRIVAYLDGLQAKVDALKKLQTDTAAELDALLPSILDKAFKGEL